MARLSISRKIVIGPASTTGRIDLAQEMLGHADIKTITGYLGDDVSDELAAGMETAMQVTHESPKQKRSTGGTS